MSWGSIRGEIKRNFELVLTYGDIIKKVMAFGDHKACRLGKWYLSKGKEDFGNTNAYQAADKPHSLVHTYALKNIAFIDDGTAMNTSNRDEIIQNFENMESASSELFVYLDSMVQENNKEYK